MKETSSMNKIEKRRRMGLSPDSSKRLIELARLARNSFKEMNECAEKAADFGCQAVKEAVLLGQYLEEAKKLVGHGGWLKWLKTSTKIKGHREGLGETYALRLMKLASANSHHGAVLGNARSVREAFQLCGIIPQDVSQPDAVASPELRRELETAAKPKALPEPVTDVEVVDQPKSGTAEIGGDPIEARPVESGAAVASFEAMVRAAWGRLSIEERCAARQVLESLIENLNNGGRPDKEGWARRGEAA